MAGIANRIAKGVNDDRFNDIVMMRILVFDGVLRDYGYL